jgi:DMSO/TMAO reductase YedYZ molybdopterin-dependent catalytic subunit
MNRLEGAPLIPRSADNLNLEFPFSDLRSFVTPNDQFYVRSHFAVPKIETATYRLRVEGAVERPFEIGYQEFRAMPARTLTATLECAGNGRAFLKPKAKGVPWELGAVSNAEWTGVPLAALLVRAGLRDNAVEVVLEGTDEGEIGTDPKPSGKIHFARSLPTAKARGPDVVLAYRMNGADLPPAHGFPVRAIVAGWYGMASVKWLKRIIVTDRPFQGFFQTMDYSIFNRQNGLSTVVPITEMEVKALIARPVKDQIVSPDSGVRVTGAAWAGGSGVARVDVSADGGMNWAQAKLLDKPVPHAWRLWEYEWRSPSQPGRHVLMARATDQRGRVQPMEREPNRRNYMVSHVVPVEIQVR